MENDGGPAFPLGYKVGGCDHEFGMSLRDYFAAAALQGIIAACEQRDLDLVPRAVARRAYEHADAILAARPAK